MFKLFKILKRKLISFLKRKTLLEKVELLEAQVAALEVQNKKLEVQNKKLKKACAVDGASSSNSSSQTKEYVRVRSLSYLEQQAKKRRMEEKEQYIQAIIQKTGWEKNFAAKQMDTAKKELGISYAHYVEYAFYDIPAEAQKAKYAEVKAEKQAAKEKKAANKNESYLSEIMRATGWDREYAEQKVRAAHKANGVSYEHYAIYRFWELTPEEQKTYFSKGDADRLRDIYNKNSLILKIFMNKDLFCANFEEFLGRPWMSTANIQLDAFKQKFASIGKLIYKPLASSGGHGIQVFSFDDTSIESVYNTLCDLPNGIIEGYVVQHPEMQKLSLNSVNTVRIVTIQTFDDIPGVEKGKVHFVYGGVRMGHGNSYVDNLHSGGMIACINIETGVVETDAVDFANRIFKQHPDTNVTIKGFQIPYFKEIKQMIEAAGKGIPGYLGWDVAITETGPIIIELNTHPGADGLQTPFVPMRIGKRPVIEKYLGEQKVTERIPETPYGTKISGILKDGIEFYWKKLEIADGYEIFRAYQENGPFERIAVIEKRTIGTYIDGQFDHSKKSVFYTVRSFVNNEDGTRSFSEMIAAKEATFLEHMVPEREATYLYSGTSRHIRVSWGWGEPERVTWSSSDETVATVDDAGLITAISAGSCTLVCSCQEINQSVTTKVVVDRQACEPLGPIRSRFHFNKVSGCWENTDSEPTNEATVMMVGDMMCGKRQMDTQFSQAEGWNFNDSYEYVKEITASSDFAIGNLETLLAAGWPYMADETYIDNMNNCNATSRYLDAIRYGGFDAVVMANNHNCDGGPLALQETIDQVDKYRFARTGVFRSASDDRYFLANVNGITLGFVSYISEETGFNGKDENWSAEDKDALLNIFSKEKAEEDIAACRKAGAEYVIAYMHWGFKNFRNTAKHQTEDAQEVAEAGADYIVGSNPHLIQKYELLITSDGREVPCAYSIGNFQAVMNQVTGNRDSVILRIRLKKDESGRVSLEQNNYIPCHTYTKLGNNHWAPIAVDKDINTSAKKKNRKTIYTRILDCMGTEILPFKV